MVTHDPEATKYAQQTLHLEKGRLVEQRTEAIHPDGRLGAPA